MDASKGVAVVTGASSGIGRAVALALAADGFYVVAFARRQDALEKTAALAGADSSRMLAVAGDVTDERSVEKLFDAAVRAFGRVDLLFNNAGITLPAMPVEDVDPADWRRLIDINVTGSLLCAQAAFRVMKQQNPQGGRIINNGSISAHVPRFRACAYTTSKHAITGLTKALSLEGRECGISCCQIDIGNAAIERTEVMERGMLQPDGSVRPEPRMHVSLAADAVLYMANLPKEISVPSLVIMPNKMPFLGRG
ncbi:MAG: SDR family oxidoreductase [Desulfovibrionaceae bacterium]|nr:SDR family oxidoreductase [Desulfovibrionaceae bacterium]